MRYTNPRTHSLLYTIRTAADTLPPSPPLYPTTACAAAALIINEFPPLPRHCRVVGGGGLNEASSPVRPALPYPQLNTLQCMPVQRFNTVHTHTHTHSTAVTTRVSRYQKGKTNLDFTEARDSEWQWHQLGHVQVCTSLQTDNHTSTPPLSFYRPDVLPAAQPTASKH